MMAKALIDADFNDNPGVPVLKKLKVVPLYVFYTYYSCCGWAIALSIFKLSALCPMILYLFILLAMVCFRNLEERKQKRIHWCAILSRNAILVTMMLTLIVLINFFPNSKTFDLEFDSLWNSPFELSNVAVPLQISNMTIVKNGWANYIIASVIVSGIISYVLIYFQKAKPKV